MSSPVKEEKQHKSKDKRDKKDKRERKEKKKEKGKSRPEAEGQFHLVRSATRIPLAPIFAADWQEGVYEVLSSWIMKYIPTLDLVLLTYSPTIEFKNKESLPIMTGSPFLIAEIEWEGVGWRPQIGSKCVGRPVISASSHISLLLHNLFNASIPAKHIPSSKYYFDHERPNPYQTFAHKSKEKISPSPSKKTPPSSQNDNAVDEDNQYDDTRGLIGEQEEANDYGCWVDRTTDEPIGNSDGTIEFTVVSLTIANSIISVRGSLLDDPFAPLDESATLHDADNTAPNALDFQQMFGTSSQNGLVKKTKHVVFEDELSDDDRASSRKKAKKESKKKKSSE